MIPIRIIVVFPDKKVIRVSGEVGSGRTIREVVGVLAEKRQTLKELEDYDYTPLVDGVQAHEDFIIHKCVSLKIYSEMPNPT